MKHTDTYAATTDNGARWALLADWHDQVVVDDEPDPEPALTDHDEWKALEAYDKEAYDDE